MTHPLSSRGARGSRDHDDGAFPAAIGTADNAGNGLSSEDVDGASRPDSGAMLSVVADPRFTTSCSSLSDAESVPARTDAAPTQHGDGGAAPETPPCDGSLVDDMAAGDIKPLDNPVSYEVFVRQFPNYKEYEKWMNESVLVNNNSDSTEEWQANLNNSINNNNNVDADSDERKVSEAMKTLSVPVEHDDRCINNFDPSTCPKCLEQMETGPSILQKLKASFHMEDMELEPHEKELYSRHTDILLRKWTSTPAKPKHAFERSKSEPKETSKEDKPKLLEPPSFQRTKSTEEPEAAAEPPQISLPVEDKSPPEPRTPSSADSDELKRRRPKDEPRRWLERPKLICQSSDERDDESSAGSAPVRPRFPMLGRSDSLSEGESDQGDRRPSTPSRASPSLYSHLDLSDSEGRAGCTPPSTASNSRSPHTPRRYSKRPLRGPYGQMLEAEMKKPEANRKLSQYTDDLKFLEEFSNKAAGGGAGSSQSLGVASAFPAAPSAELTRSVSSGEQRQAAAPRNRHQGNLSMDDSQLRAAAKTDRLDPAAGVPGRAAERAPKRKVSAADLSSLHPGGGGAAAGTALPVCHQRTTSSPSQLEGIATRHHASVDADLFRRQVATLKLPWSFREVRCDCVPGVFMASLSLFRKGLRLPQKLAKERRSHSVFGVQCLDIFKRPVPSLQQTKHQQNANKMSQQQISILDTKLLKFWSRMDSSVVSAEGVKFVWAFLE
ncbi:nucleolar protein dao-5-like [Thrips palmi]|uniref:Nucleolar protein dao-5-like n=1 Tax=Thrips palmi TaxID=161013 RepID=A0A6P9A8X5_THRPL|nr:nucleolar protein dao-5-like [Thrips palmi]